MPNSFQGNFLPKRDRDGSWVRAMEGRPVVSEGPALGRERTFAGNQIDEMRASHGEKTMSAQRTRFAMIMLLSAVTTTGLFSQTVQANPINGGVEAPVPDVFSNYYYPPIPPGPYPGVGAQLYVSPQPVPARVGHTWVTYPPFMPHEFLYQHRRRYVRCSGAMGMRNVTNAYWW